MKDLEMKLLKVCGNDKKVFKKVKIEVFHLLKNPEFFENEEIGFNYTDKDLNPRMKKDLEVLDLEIFANIYLFLKEIGYKPTKNEVFNNYYTQYFKK